MPEPLDHPEPELIDVRDPARSRAALERLGERMWREALDGMLGALSDDPDARRAMLEVFTVLGDDDELVSEYRRKLASALF